MSAAAQAHPRQHTLNGSHAYKGLLSGTGGSSRPPVTPAAAGDRLEHLRYYELMEKDVVRLGQSTREYVLLHDQSKDE